MLLGGSVMGQESFQNVFWSANCRPLRKGLHMAGIENNRGDSQYQLLECCEHAGFVQYRTLGRKMWALRSSLSRRFTSPALVTRILGHVLQGARHKRFSTLPFWSAMRAFIRIHPEYANLIPLNWRPPVCHRGCRLEHRQRQDLTGLHATHRPRRAWLHAPAVVAP